MPIHKLRYESPEKLFILAGDCDAHSARLDQCRISEAFIPDTHPDIGAGSYRIALEADVASLDEHMAVCVKAIEFAEQLDIAWCYIFGEPFKATRSTIVLNNGPLDWNNNFWDVQAAIQREAGRPCFALMATPNHRLWISSPFLPLKNLLKIRDAYLAAPPILRELIGLHVSAHKAPLGKLLMLAKALEIVGRHYGTTRATRNSGMQQAMNDMGVARHLKQNVEWLFNIANERFDIRHAVDNDAAGVSLHPKLNPIEHRDCEEDATLAIRAFICERLGVALNIFPTK
jgi:hypothetical protein